MKIGNFSSSTSILAAAQTEGGLKLIYRVHSVYQKHKISMYRLIFAQHTRRASRIRRAQSWLAPKKKEQERTTPENVFHADRRHISPHLRRARMTSGAHGASATLACTPGAERTTPKAMQQFHLRFVYMWWAGVGSSGGLNTYKI